MASPKSYQFLKDLISLIGKEKGTTVEPWQEDMLKSVYKKQASDFLDAVKYSSNYINWDNIYGTDWRTTAKVDSSAVGQSSNSAGRADPRTATVQVTPLFTTRAAYNLATDTYEESEEPKPKPIPHAGIRTGELIGYRQWRVCVIRERLPYFHVGDLELFSLVASYRWKPGLPVAGDINKLVYEFPPIWAGVYANKEEKSYDNSHWVSSFGVGNQIWSTVARVYGTVSMWGEVVEHETGYRAQYAKLRSLDKLVPYHYQDGSSSLDIDLDDLRKIYGVP